MASSARPKHLTQQSDRRDARREFHLGLFNPSDGVAGMWGPSTMSSALMAIEEVNANGGINGRMISWHTYSADDEADVCMNAEHALCIQKVDAIVGMHTSSVRSIIRNLTKGMVPYVYTPLYEGGETTPGVYAIGETPDRQLKPAIRLLVERYRARKWMLLGNDYVWPRKSHALARQYLKDSGGEVQTELYLGIGKGPGQQNFEEVFERIEHIKPDAILISLVGQDAIDFNREFGRRKLSKKIIRLSCAIEENGLLAIGANNTEGLFVSSGYFASLRSEANMSFVERYHDRFGERAPALNSIGQSTYEGVHFLAALASKCAAEHQTMASSHVADLRFHSVRGTTFRNRTVESSPIYLAEAQGHLFQVLNHLA